jgi:hypothetical protein
MFERAHPQHQRPAHFARGTAPWNPFPSVPRCHLKGYQRISSPPVRDGRLTEPIRIAFSDSSVCLQCPLGAVEQTRPSGHALVVTVVGATPGSGWHDWTIRARRSEMSPNPPEQPMRVSTPPLTADAF